MRRLAPVLVAAALGGVGVYLLLRRKPPAATVTTGASVAASNASDAQVSNAVDRLLAAFPELARKHPDPNVQNSVPATGAGDGVPILGNPAVEPWR